MGDFSVMSMFTQASLIVQMVMLVLGVASLVSWAIIFNKSRVLRKEQGSMQEFEDQIWEGADLFRLYEKLRASELKTFPEEVFCSGLRGYTQLGRSGQLSAETISHVSERKMKVKLVQQTEHLEVQLPTLATIGSVSPYVGLFGTVWGIINAFHSLDPSHGASMLATIAPGISEALVATALGLFAAIPAVVAYNHYVERVDKLMAQYDIFVEEFTVLLQRETIIRSSQRDSQ